MKKGFHCSKCGNPVSVNDLFCSYCGHKINIDVIENNIHNETLKDKNQQMEVFWPNVISVKHKGNIYLKVKKYFLNAVSIISSLILSVIASVFGKIMFHDPIAVRVISYAVPAFFMGLTAGFIAVLICSLLLPKEKKIRYKYFFLLLCAVIGLIGGLPLAVVVGAISCLCMYKLSNGS